ncbi:retrovirus-related Pol polyprotein from transposon opus [Trichonephila clavipes]|nr:retrovirus-related Pol polyprotein from transposon opus [Trichonephila clavipes]
MQDFLAHQSERKLRHNESLVDYICSKDALLEKVPFNIPQPDHISMIIGDIKEEKWQIALAIQNSNTVEELIHRATALDAIHISEITLFGRIVSEDGVRPDPEHTAAIERHLTVKSIQDVLSFLGFANQFRKYNRNYAVIAKPLTSVLKGLEEKISNDPIVLIDDQQLTLENLKTTITTVPIISYFKQGLPTFVETDASYSRKGAILSQDRGSAFIPHVTLSGFFQSMESHNKRHRLIHHKLIVSLNETMTA